MHLYVLLLPFTHSFTTHTQGLTHTNAVNSTELTYPFPSLSSFSLSDAVCRTLEDLYGEEEASIRIPSPQFSRSFTPHILLKTQSCWRSRTALHASSLFRGQFHRSKHGLRG